MVANSRLKITNTESPTRGWLVVRRRSSETSIETREMPSFCEIDRVILRVVDLR